MKLKKRRSKNIEIRKSEQIVHHPNDNWVVLMQRQKENSTKDLKKRAMKERVAESEALRQPKRLSKIKPSGTDNGVQRYYNKPENKLVNHVLFRETAKPQRLKKK